jgi:DNA helicase HerA-like ATPase
MNDPLQPQPVPDDLLDDFGEPGPSALPEPPDGTVGYTHFDAPGSEDDQVSVLLTRRHLDSVVPGAMVRIDSPADPLGQDADQRRYQGVVIAGPYAEPDGLGAGSPIAQATTLGGKARVLLPNYHGRATVQVTAEQVGDVWGPPQHRPRPNSPIVPLSDAETAVALKFDGDVPLGTLLGNANVPLALDTAKKHQLPRHLGILGTTGGGKSNTVARLVGGLQRGGASVVLLDVEGEYVDLDKPADHPDMVRLLRARGIDPEGVGDFNVMHPIGRESARADATPFSLRFEELSPYAVMNLLDLSDAQETRFLKAFDVLKRLMRQLGLFPQNEADRDRLLELDEFDAGYPGMTLAMLRDVVNACADRADAEARKGDEDGQHRPLFSPRLRDHAAQVRQAVATARPPGHFPSWAALLGKMNRLVRLGLFDSADAPPINVGKLTAPGRVTVLDLSDTDSPIVNNLVIASLLRAVQRRQEADAKAAADRGEPVSPTIVVIEEAHEFLSAARIKQQPHLFEQVARIAKRGRKRWLGLCFVTQLPQHLPDEVLGLINNHVLHAVRDPGVVQRLARQVPGLDRGQWRRLTALAPGQAIVSLATAARPVVAQIDPAPCRLRLVD